MTTEGAPWFEVMRTSIADPVLDLRLTRFFEDRPLPPVERRGAVFDLVTGSKRLDDVAASLLPNQPQDQAALRARLAQRPGLNEAQLALISAGRREAAEELATTQDLYGGEHEARATRPASIPRPVDSASRVTPPPAAPSPHPSAAPSPHPSAAPSPYPPDAPSPHPSAAPSPHPPATPSPYPPDAGGPARNEAGDLRRLEAALGRLELAVGRLEGELQMVGQVSRASVMIGLLILFALVFRWGS